MSVRNLTVYRGPGENGKYLRIRKPPKPFYPGDVIKMKTPDGATRNLLVGSSIPTSISFCDNCVFNAWEFWCCPRTLDGRCIILHTCDNNRILDLDKHLEDL